MRNRVIQILIIFAASNAVGVLIFYGWIFSHQVWQRKPSSVPRVSGGGPGAKPPDWQNEIHGQYRYHQDSRQLKYSGLPSSSPGSILRPLVIKHDIRPVPDHSLSDDVPPLDAAIMQKYRDYPQKPAKDSIIILTPIHNVAGRLKTFLHLLQSINYPHSLISIAFGEDSSHDNTLHIADDIAVELRKSFARVDVFHFSLGGQINGSWSTIHDRVNQFHRRRHLAQARNALLRAALKNQDWALWIDSDLSHLPPDIIQQLLSAEKEVVAPLCVYMDHKRKRVYDKNTWRETNSSLGSQKNLSPDFLVFEGYHDTKRLWLSDLRAEGRVVPIDGVGGCTLLIQSKCHEKGLIFPEKAFQHHIETEGLAKLAKHMGYGVYGMPFVEVIH